MRSSKRGTRHTTASTVVSLAVLSKPQAMNHSRVETWPLDHTLYDISSGVAMQNGGGVVSPAAADAPFGDDVCCLRRPEMAIMMAAARAKRQPVRLRAKAQETSR